MRFLLLGSVALLCGCGAEDPAVVLRAALADAAATPHSFKGKVTRTLMAKRAKGEWNLRGAAANGWVETVQEMAGLEPQDMGKPGSMLRRQAFGRGGWWVENYRGVWRAYPPPHEYVEGMNPDDLTKPAWAADQSVGGKTLRRIEADHPAGKLGFDLDGKRLARIVGALTDAEDVYVFEITLEYGAVKVEPPKEAALVLDALTGAAAGGKEDTALREEALALLQGIPGKELSTDVLQIDWAAGREYARKSGYIEQSPPHTAWNFSEGVEQKFIFSDGKRTVSSNALTGDLKEESNTRQPTSEGIERMVASVALAGEGEHKGKACRVLVAALQPPTGESREGTKARAWLWVAPDGTLVRQMIVGRMPAAEGGELMNCVDMIFTHEKPKAGLVERAKQIFAR
jgi:hypothetical protein